MVATKVMRFYVAISYQMLPAKGEKSRKIKAEWRPINRYVTGCCVYGD